MKPTLYSARKLLRADLASIAVFLLAATHPYFIESAKAQIASSSVKERDKELAKSELNLCQNLQPVHTLRGHLGEVKVLAKTSDDKTLITGSEDGSVQIWVYESGILKASFNEHIGTIQTIKILPDDKTVLSSSSGFFDSYSNDFLMEIKLWDIETKEIIYSIETSARNLEVSEDWKFIITSGRDSDTPINLLETATGEKVNQLYLVSAIRIIK